MWFLVKCAFWLGVVVMLLPMPEGERPAHVQASSAGETIGVLTTALADARGFCARNPEACARGAVALQDFGHRAQYGARLLHEFIAEQLEETRHLVPPPGSRAAQPAAGVDTLSPTDREPAWRGPDAPAPAAPAQIARRG
jgi:hypothetical protein